MDTTHGTENTYLGHDTKACVSDVQDDEVRQVKLVHNLHAKLGFIQVSEIPPARAQTPCLRMSVGLAQVWTLPKVGDDVNVFFIDVYVQPIHSLGTSKQQVGSN